MNELQIGSRRQLMRCTVRGLAHCEQEAGDLKARDLRDLSSQLTMCVMVPYAAVFMAWSGPMSCMDRPKSLILATKPRPAQSTMPPSASPSPPCRCTDCSSTLTACVRDYVHD